MLTGIGEVGNVICGDTVKMSVKLTDNKDGIADVKFMTYGCMFSIACADELADMAIGKSVDAVVQINDSDVVQSLDGLPIDKTHCATMAVVALKSALKKASVNAEVEIGSGLKELNGDEDKKTIFSISEETQIRHRIAEMFDEYFIPYAARVGCNLQLFDVDVRGKIVSINEIESQNTKRHIARMLDKYLGYGWKVETR